MPGEVVLTARVYDPGHEACHPGRGPAGYAAAATAAHLGAEVTLVEDNQLGGNCTMTDAIPSKTLLTTADAMLEISRAESDGVDFVHGFRQPAPHPGPGQGGGAASELGCVGADGRHERPGAARLGCVKGRNDLVVNDGRDHEVPFDALLVCTGASPFTPPFAHPDGHRADHPPGVRPA